jgi:hypothetical protein
MRHKIVTILTAGAVGATTFAVAGPALASGTAPTAASVATAVTSQLDRIKQALAGLVTNKTLTQAQANKVAETLKSTDLGPGGPGGPGGPHGFGGPGGPGGPGGGPELATAATTLKMTETELRTALDSGKTLAAVAKQKNVPVNTLIVALVKAEKARIAQDVKDGRITQVEANQRLKDVTARVTEHVNSTRPPRPDHDRGVAPGTASSSTGTAPPST